MPAVCSEAEEGHWHALYAALKQLCACHLQTQKQSQGSRNNSIAAQYARRKRED